MLEDDAAMDRSNTLEMPDYADANVAAPARISELRLWTRISNFVLKRIFADVSVDTLTVEERERRQWDRSW